VQGEATKDAVKRLKDKVRITFDKSKFSQLISDLRNSNNDLKLLREQAAELCKGASDPDLLRIATVPATSTPAITQRRLPPEFSSYSATRRAAQALYDALWAAWSTQDAARFRHWAKLFLETKTENGVYLNLILSCIQQDMDLSHQPLPNIFKLHVQSQLLDEASGQPPASSLELPNSKRRRVVRFAQDETCDGAIGKQETASTPPDLRCSQHLCSELHFSKTLPTCTEAEAVGYLDTCCSQDRSFRHSFYHCRQGLCDPTLCSGVGGDSRKLTRPRPSHGQQSSAESDTQPTRLDQLLSEPRNQELSVPDQLQLALRIAAAVLKFNSTSWLSEYWGLQDLYLFEDGPDLPASLQTLHLGVEWSSECHTAAIDGTSLDQVPDPNQAVEEAKLVHGIHNTTLYNLGVALLSIGRWIPINPHDILAVRRMALQASPLGPKFQHMTQRVLDCDFGCGKDLTKSRLQKAVYDGVLIELESMISALSIQSSQ